MLICGHCGDTVKDLHGLWVHLKCEQKPLPLVVVENTSDNTASTPCLCSQCPSVKQCVGGEKFDSGNGL
jgi:hypothetical protein